MFTCTYGTPWYGTMTSNQKIKHKITKKMENLVKLYIRTSISEISCFLIQTSLHTAHCPSHLHSPRRCTHWGVPLVGCARWWALLTWHKWAGIVRGGRRAADRPAHWRPWSKRGTACCSSHCSSTDWGRLRNQGVHGYTQYADWICEHITDTTEGMRLCHTQFELCILYKKR